SAGGVADAEDAVTAIAQIATTSAIRIRRRGIYRLPSVEVAFPTSRFAYGVSCRARAMRYGRGNASDSPRADPSAGHLVPPSAWSSPPAVRRRQLYMRYPTASSRRADAALRHASK